MATPYSKENQEFTNRAHDAAQRLLYPSLFGVEQDQLSFECTSLGLGERQAFLDGQMAIDRIVKVQVPGLGLPLSFTVQERFRKPKYASFRDITITEWNLATDRPSELYKLNAGLFIYGYYDAIADRFIEAIAVDVPWLLIMFPLKLVDWSLQENPRTSQTFFCFKFDDLFTSGAVCGYWRSLCKHNGDLHTKFYRLARTAA